MIDSRLLLLEGLPGSGKSTNSQFLQMQMERGGYPVKWRHEIARPNPTQFFHEACFTLEEYRAFLDAYGQAREILDHAAVFYRRHVGIDLLEIQWKYRSAIGECAYQALLEYDGWNMDAQSRDGYLSDKWAAFAEEVLREPDCVYILDSSLFQFQIFGGLLQNRSRETINGIIRRLIDLVRPLNPALFYLRRDNVEDSIRFLENKRGARFFEELWERDRTTPYYRNRRRGAEGVKQFLREYAAMADSIFADVACRKRSVSIGEEDWGKAEDEMLSFLELPRKPAPGGAVPTGTYRNDQLGLTVHIRHAILQDPDGVGRKLTPRAENHFYVENLPTVLRLDENGRLVVAAGQICARWTTLGTVYHPADRA